MKNAPQMDQIDVVWMNYVCVVNFVHKCVFKPVKMRKIRG